MHGSGVFAAVVYGGGVFAAVVYGGGGAEGPGVLAGWVVTSEVNRDENMVWWCFNVIVQVFVLF